MKLFIFFVVALVSSGSVQAEAELVADIPTWGFTIHTEEGDVHFSFGRQWVQDNSFKSHVEGYYATVFFDKGWKEVTWSIPAPTVLMRRYPFLLPLFLSLAVGAFVFCALKLALKLWARRRKNLQFYRLFVLI